MTKTYELLYIIPFTSEKEEIQSTLQKVKESIKGMNVELLSQEEIGKRKIAYPIKRHRYGYYSAIVFRVDSEKIEDIQQKLRLMPEILRFQIVNVRLQKPKAREAKKEKKLEEKTKKIEKEMPRKEKVVLEDIDKKIDEILKEEIIK